MLTKHKHPLESPPRSCARLCARGLHVRALHPPPLSAATFSTFFLSFSSTPSSLSLSLFLSLGFPLTRRSLNIDQRGRHVANDGANGQLVEPRANAGKRWPLIRLSSTLASICLITCSRHGAVLISVRSNVPPQFHFRRGRRNLARDGGLNSPSPENILLHVSASPSDPLFLIISSPPPPSSSSSSSFQRGYAATGWDDVVHAITRDGRLRFDSITRVLASNIDRFRFVC